MVSGAASADAAIMVVDAEEGVREQSRRHAYLLHLLGVRREQPEAHPVRRQDRPEPRHGAAARSWKSCVVSIIGRPAHSYHDREPDDHSLWMAN